ncbi:eukaryotic initiation factor-2 beta [Cystoisospora suis]|uniref:Eukaryotic initiation factor-2 beta n=1 Tax=Cystoisospora suis TaxID=483139 RepID=A0A2C6KMX8_9APIC|nr:eukaryotic initiation factor-2 beta [Cystoisospora suis]
MLERIQTLIEKHNPDLSGAKRYTIKPPQVVRVGSKKVAWINFKDICSIMNRQPDHVHQFVLAELGTEGSIAGDGQLVLKGKYGPKHIEALLRKYISKHGVQLRWNCWLADVLNHFFPSKPTRMVRSTSHVRCVRARTRPCKGTAERVCGNKAVWLVGPTDRSQPLKAVSTLSARESDGKQSSAK